MNIEKLKQYLHTSEIDLKRLQYLYGDKDCQDDILKLKHNIELLKILIKEDIYEYAE